MLGLYFRIEPSDLPEPPPIDEAPGPYAARLAREKAEAVAKQFSAWDRDRRGHRRCAGIADPGQARG